VKDFTLHPDDQDRVLMVDVGGGGGQQCIALRQAHPELKGRVVLQDLPGTIAVADQDTLKKLHIESQAHDFMTPEPVTGAKVYYMRNILHDWPDATCMIILKHLRAAMSDDSVIMIDEIVVQKSESTWKQVNYDFVMMCALGGIERTKEHWQELLSGAKLRLRDVISFDKETGDSVLIAQRAA
jgi:demethylsterigmatocystin 6-O-methyltransferase